VLIVRTDFLICIYVYVNLYTYKYIHLSQLHVKNSYYLAVLIALIVQFGTNLC